MRHRTPYCQFDAQYGEELERLRTQSQDGAFRLPDGVSLFAHTRDAVKHRWIEQGIWKDEWNEKYKPDGRWKHEEPAKHGSDAEEPSQLERAAKRPKRSGDDDQQRDASCPYYQFIYQVSGARERIQEALHPGQRPPFPLSTDAGQQADQEPGVEITTPPPNINTTTYERVKATWVRRGIWNTKWGILPGMSWKHEQPQEDFLREEMGREPEFGEPSQADVTGHEIHAGRHPAVAPGTNGNEAMEVIPQRSLVSAGVKPILSPPPAGLDVPPQDQPLAKPVPPPEANPISSVPRGRAARNRQATRSQASRKPTGGAARSRRAKATKETVKAGQSAQAPDDSADPPPDADTTRRSRRLQAAEDRTPTHVQVDGKQSNRAPRRTKRTSARVAKQSAPAKAQRVNKGRSSRRR
jgi:hypothetical protein